MSSINENIRGNCTLSMSLARSPHYHSQVVVGDSTFAVSFNTPVQLRVIGVATGTDVTLHLSETIVDTTWTTYEIDVFVPDEVYAIKLSPNYDPAYNPPYAGNVLIDRFELSPR